MAITIQQIAERSGVAPSTVSAALSPVCKKRISKDRIKQIRSMAKKMGYRPNLSARRLRTGRTYDVGVVILSFLQHHPLSIYFDFISKACRKRGYNAVPMQISRHFEELENPVRELQEHHVDGLLFLDYRTEWYEQYLKMWQSRNLMVFRVLDPVFSGIPFDNFLVDHYSAMIELMNHLVSQGWTDLIIALEDVSFEGPKNASNSQKIGCYRGWSDFVNTDNGEGAFISKEMAKFKGRTAKSKYDLVRSMAESGRFKKGKTCLVLDGGDGSSGAYGALSEAGFAVGKDVGVAALNGVPSNEMLFPEITRLSEPYSEIAEAMVEELVNNMDDEREESGKQLSFKPELIVGPSTLRL